MCDYALMLVDAYYAQNCAGIMYASLHTEDIYENKMWIFVSIYVFVGVTIADAFFNYICINTM